MGAPLVEQAFLQSTACSWAAPSLQSSQLEGVGQPGALFSSYAQHTL